MRIPALILLFSVLFMSCNRMRLKSVRGDGEARTETRTTGNFTSLEVTGPFKVYVSQGSSHTIEVKSDANLLPYILTRVSGSTLEIYPKKGYSLRPRTGIEVFITSPEYEKFTVTGSGNIRSSTVLTGSKFVSEIAGSGDIMLDVDAPEVKAEVTGSGNVVLKGRTKNLDSEINGSGEIYAFELLSENAKVEIAGSGDAEVYASKTLDIQIAGSGNIDYKGDPVVKKSVAGSGNIRKAD